MLLVKLLAELKKVIYRPSALIDGPKEFRALKLAFKLLATGKPSAVFIHDLWLGKAARAFLQSHVPHAFFSDEPEFVKRYFHLDGKSGTPPADLSQGYGATLACIPAGPINYGRLLVKLTIARIFSRKDPDE